MARSYIQPKKVHLINGCNLSNSHNNTSIKEEVTCTKCLMLLTELVSRVSFPEIPSFEATQTGCRFVFNCPCCGKKNVHKFEEGYHTAHCPCWEKGYYLKRKTT